jgi:secreted trypsin-like serine protease
LIAGDILLTTASCKDSFLPGQKVYVGGIRRDGSDATSVTVSRNLPHPMFGTENLFDNNFMLVKIVEDLSTVPVPALNTDSAVPPDGATCVNFGFGFTEVEGFSDVLLQVQLATVNQEQCSEVFGSVINDSMLCAGGESGRGSCFGDDGSPLLFNGKIVGLVSGGLDCGVEDVPVVR